MRSECRNKCNLSKNWQNLKSQLRWGVIFPRRLFLPGSLGVDTTLLPTNNRTPHKTTHTRSSTNCPTMIYSAFARSRPLMARYDVSPHMTKWWKAVRPDDGQVRPVSSDIARFRWYGNQAIVNPTLALHRVGFGNTRVRRGWN